MKKFVCHGFVVAVNKWHLLAALWPSLSRGAIKNEATKAATDVAKGQLAKEINKDLAGVSCNYNAKTKAISGCDLRR
jgi:hypothetical protein